QSIYGQFYLGRPMHGTAASVEKLTAEDCQAFHKQVMVPENVAVAVVGDFNNNEMIAEITKLTAEWQGKLPAAPAEPELMMAPATTTRLSSMPRRGRLQMFVGHPGIKR